MRSAVRFCAAAALGSWMLFLASCASPGVTEFELVPAKGTSSQTSIDEGRVTLTADYLDADGRTMYLRERGYEALGAGIRPVPLVTFVLHVSNGSDRQVILEPGSIRLAVGYGPLLSPYSYAHLYMELPKGSDRQRILEDLGDVVIGRTTTIAPGEGVEGLLLFKRPEKVSPKAALLFQRLYVGDKENQAVLDFDSVDLAK